MQEKDTSLNLWNEKEIKTLTPYHKWGNEPARLLIQKGIRNYEIKSYKNTFNPEKPQYFIEILVWNPNFLDEFEDEEGNPQQTLGGFELMKFNVSSVRLRNALIESEKLITKLPCEIVVTREGVGYSTTFNCKLPSNVE